MCSPGSKQSSGTAASSSCHLMMLADSLPVLRDGILSYLALWGQHRDVHPAVLSAVLSRPPGERPVLLDAVYAHLPPSRSARPDPEGQSPSTSSGVTSPNTGRRRRLDNISAEGSEEKRPRLSRVGSVDSEDVWEDALEELSWLGNDSVSDTGCEDIKADVSTTTEIPASEKPGKLDDKVPVGANLSPSRDLLGDLERCRESWRCTRDLAQWERYQQLRRRVGGIRIGNQSREVAGQEAPHLIFNPELAMQREHHEARLQELLRRRQRQQWAQQYDRSRMQDRVREQKKRLEEELLRLDREQVQRRSRFQQRIQELQQQLRETEPLTRLNKSLAEPSPNGPQEAEVFTHVWDDIQMWEHIISSPEKEKKMTKRPAESTGVEELLSGISALVLEASSVERHPSRIRQHGASKGKKGGYHERKKWFEEALLAWHAQDDVRQAESQAHLPAGSWFKSEQQPWAAWNSHSLHSSSCSEVV